MKRSNRMVWTVVPTAVLLSAGATVAVLVFPWNTAALPAPMLGLLKGGAVWAPAIFGGDAPQATPEMAVIDEPPAAAEIADHDMVIEIAANAAIDDVLAAPPPPAPAPPEPVDYARLNDEVMLVAETLDRFNQKLLLLLAQAKASSQKAEQAAEARDAGDDDDVQPAAEPAAEPSAGQPAGQADGNELTR